MKKIFVIASLAILFFACNNAPKSVETKNNEESKPVVQVKSEDVKAKAFDELFTSIKPTEITDNVFKLVGEDYTVITGGKADNYNSMTANFGGWGRLFDYPVTWCFLRANRYTLEYIKEKKTYTMSYFTDQYKDEVLFFGSQSGRGTDKMNNHALTMVETPLGNITYKEARFILECEVIEITTVNPNDFFSERGKQFVVEAYAEAKDYHKLVFGKIANVWIRK
ncbi:MAG: flavin reductase [Prevotellaceae bacterium]|jgi:flavin reductase (DIM6/NTAB) family NADH-FMN oxidoreductase RutF|nr:flavin reductase [Prevotellaceae bacterium]